MNNKYELLKEKDRLIKEYQVACKAGIHDSYLYNRIMEINNKIMPNIVTGKQIGRAHV